MLRIQNAYIISEDQPSELLSELHFVQGFTPTEIQIWMVYISDMMSTFYNVVVKLDKGIVCSKIYQTADCRHL